MTTLSPLPQERQTADDILPLQIQPVQAQGEPVIIIGASTGGTEAIKQILMQMPSDCPGILIAQHMPAKFTHAFADRLNDICHISVSEAVHGTKVLAGHAYVAPGSAHLLLARAGGHYQCELNAGQPINHHRPSIDVLFRSAANNAGRCAVGIILTGMGKDGATGMLEMHRAGAHNIAQDEQSCVVYGMPKEATALGGVDEVVPLSEIAGHVLAYLARLKIALPAA